MRIGTWRFALSALLLLSVLSLAGCGESGSQGSEPGGQQTAPDKVKLGLAVANSFPFLTAYVAEDRGIFKKHNLEVEIVPMPAEAKLHEAMASGSLDMGMASASGTAAAVVRGVPESIVGALDDGLKLFVLVAKESIKSQDDLKGKTIGITAPGSLTDLLVKELVQKKGWPADSVKSIALGGFPQQLAAFKTGQTDAFVWTYDGAVQVEDQGLGKTLFSFAEVTPDFLSNVVLGHSKFIQAKPDVAKRMVASLFEAIQYEKANKEYTVALFEKKMQFPKSVGAKVYDYIIDHYSSDGTWNEKNMQAVAQSLVAQGVSQQAPPVEKLAVKQFVPVQVSK